MTGTLNRNSFTAIVVLALFGPQMPAHASKAGGDSGKPEISDVKLYTLPARPVCGEPVKLVAEIHATKPGTVDFTLLRRVGRSQKASMIIGDADGDLVERWEKEFTYKSSVKREYMVIIADQKFSTSWVPVEVDCDAQPPEISQLSRN